MAKYYLWSGATGAGTGADKANAFTTLAAAIAAASSSGDYILVHKTHTETRGADVSYTTLASINIICVDADASDAPAVQTSAQGFLDGGNLSWELYGNGHSVLMYGVNITGTGTGVEVITFAGTTAGGGDINLRSCTIDLSGTSGTQDFAVRIGNADSPCAVTFTNCVVKLRNSYTYFNVLAAFKMVGGSITGGTLGNLINFQSTLDISGGYAEFVGVDMSGVTSVSALVGDSNLTTGTARFDRCRLPATAPLLAAQTLPGVAGNRVFVWDCHSGDTHGYHGYADGTGSVVSDFTIKRTAGAAGQSWRITTTAKASAISPFVTPPIQMLNDTLSSMTPYVEILRNGSATAYKDNQVWANFMAKVTSGSTLATSSSTAQSLAARIAGTTGTDIPAGVGLAAWEGEITTGAPDAWSGKLVAPSAITPAEVGVLSAQISVAEPTISDLYVDVEIGG